VTKNAQPSRPARPAERGAAADGEADTQGEPVAAPTTSGAAAITGAPDSQTEPATQAEPVSQAEPASQGEATERDTPNRDTVEAVVRGLLSKALGGKRGMAEAAVPTLAFTCTFLATRNLPGSLIAGGAAAVVLLAIRLIQRSTPQFVLNSLVGIGVAALFALRSGRPEDVFLPGILYNAGYAAVMILTIALRWPLVGFLIGSVTGDPTSWHADSGVVRLCTKLTWLLAVPCLVRVVVQYPLYLTEQVFLLGVTKIVLGWPLQVAALAAMLWVLMRGRTPVKGQLV
jgi:hypothetical protein